MKRIDLMLFGALLIAYGVLQSRAQFTIWRDKFRESPLSNYLRADREKLIAEEMSDGRA